MARKKKKLKEQTQDTSVILFVSLMLILLSFFIMLNSIAVIDSNKMRVALNSLIGEFGGLAGQRGFPGPSEQMSVGEHPKVDLEKLNEAFEEMLEGTDLEGKFDIAFRGKDLVLTVPGTLVMHSDPKNMPDQSRNLLQNISRLLVKTAKPIRIEGHAAPMLQQEEDTVDMRLWQESVGRAQNVANYLIDWGIPADQLSVAGYGTTRPLYSSDMEEGRLRNQRVEIIVVDGAEDPAIRFHPIDVKIGRWTFRKIEYRGTKSFERIE